MTKNIKKSDVDAKEKSTKLSWILTVIPAAIVDFISLNTLWAAADEGKLTAQVPLKEDASTDNFLTIECKGNTVVPVVNPGESPYDGNAQITGVVEGVNEKTLAWAYDAQGQEAVVIATRCSDGKRFIFGSPCSGGMTFQYQSIGAQDGGTAGINFQFTSADCPKPMLVYAPASAQNNG